jgi:hypothetical protein
MDAQGTPFSTASIFLKKSSDLHNKNRMIDKSHG